MTAQFKTIGIFAKQNGNGITETLKQLMQFLTSRNLKFILEDLTANLLDLKDMAIAPSLELGKLCDLILVVGGDGSLLRAARAIVDSGIPVVGINRGSLGFLADIHPEQIESQLDKILEGKYIQEQRTMLNITVKQENNLTTRHLALNDVVLHHGDIARLIEFKVYIDDQVVIDQRGDGIIVSTPTGSTGYALSGGGPIVYPTLDVITLTPMFPHTLNTRPIVIDKRSKVKLELSATNRNNAKISCDGQFHLTINPNDQIHVQAHDKNLILLHPTNYQYYTVLREKLGWHKDVNANNC